MGDQRRHKRLRLLIRKLNKDRKKQALRTDILCNDIIAAQREFIKRLRTISSTANFYESIIGMTDLNSLLHTAVKIIEAENPGAHVSFFLRRTDSFELCMYDGGRPMAFEEQQLGGCFTPELMDSICKSNKVRSLDDMFEMGLQGNLVELKGISAVTIPLGLFGSSLGFMLVCRSSENKLTPTEISNISAVTFGLSQAIASCQALSHASDR